MRTACRNCERRQCGGPAAHEDERGCACECHLLNEMELRALHEREDLADAEADSFRELLDDVDFGPAGDDPEEDAPWV